jgi:hypothetical protein
MQACLSLGALVAGGCEGRSLEDDLRMTVTGDAAPVVVDLACDGCGTWVEVEVYFDPDAYVAEDDEVVIEQYRIDYELDRVDEQPPFLAGQTEQHVWADDRASFLLSLAGSAQIEHVREHSGGDAVEGRATLTVAGYDDQDEQVFVEKALAIRFEYGSGAEQESAP